MQGLVADRFQCDETGPPCGSCSLRKTPCSYSSPAERGRTRSAASTERRHSASSSIEPAFGGSTGVYLQELKFLHQYTIATHQNLTDIFETPNLWQIDVVRDAFNHDFLLNGIFSLVALEEAHKNPDSSAALSITSIEYMEPALRRFRTLLGDITTNNENALFAFSCIISLSTFAQLRMFRATDLTWGTLMDKLQAVLECVQGARNLVIASELWNKPGPFLPYLSSLQDKDIRALDPDINHALDRLHFIHTDMTMRTVTISSRDELLSTAIDRLRECWWRKILSVEWLNDMGKAFLIELRNQDPVAKLILAHWGASLISINQYWWGAGTAKNIVACATQELEQEFVGGSLEFLDAIRWPRKYVGLDDLETS
jgi:hypothetical protein